MSNVSLTSVLNDIADKFMNNTKKVEDSNLKNEIKNEIMRNNSVIGDELTKIKDQLTQVGGQQNIPNIMQVPMGYPSIIPPQQVPQQQVPQQQVPQQQVPPQQVPQQQVPPQKVLNEKNTKKNDELDEIDERIIATERKELKDKQNKSLFEAPGKLLGTLGSVAASALSTNDENINTNTMGIPIQLPSQENIMKDIGKGLSNATDTIKSTVGMGEIKDKEDSSLLGNVANSMLSSVKQIGKNALGTVSNAANITNKAVGMVTHKKCNPEFMNDIGNIIDSCDRDNYIDLYNIIINKLKLKKNNFRENIKNKIEKLESLDLNKEEKLKELENNLTIDLNEVGNNVKSKKQTKKKSKKDKVKLVKIDMPRNNTTTKKKKKENKIKTNNIAKKILGKSLTGKIKV